MTGLRYPNGIVWLILAALALGGPVSTTIGSLAANILALSLIPLLFHREAWAALRSEPFFPVTAAALLVLAICFALTAQAPADLRFIGNFLPFLLAAPVYLAARQTAGPRAALAFCIVCMGGAVVAICLGLFDIYLRGHWRTQGVFSSSILIARHASLLGFAACAGFFLITGPKRYLFWLGAPLAGLAVILTGARGSLVALPVLALVFWLFVLTEKASAKRFRDAGLLAALGIAAIAAVLLFFEQSRGIARLGVLEALLTGGAVDNSTSERLEFWQAGWQLFLQSPWLGYGWAHIADIAFTVLDEADYGGAFSPAFFHFHNDFFNFAVAAGIPGILVFLAFLAAPLAGWRRGVDDGFAHARRYVLVMLVVLYVITGLTDIGFGWDMPTTAYAFFAALVLGLLGPADAKASSLPSSR